MASEYRVELLYNMAKARVDLHADCGSLSRSANRLSEQRHDLRIDY